MSFKGQPFILLAAWELYHWIGISIQSQNKTAVGKNGKKRPWEQVKEMVKKKMCGMRRKGEPSWGKRLELFSPVVCTRWCSLIIHCMRWMSLSPHTALLHSALCLSAPGGIDGDGEGCIGLQCLDVAGLSCASCKHVCPNLGIYTNVCIWVKGI